MTDVKPPIAFTIAGFDTGGAVGLHADIKTFTALHVYSVSALTATTLQDSEEIYKVRWSTASFLQEQIKIILEDYGCDAAKTGFIGKAALIKVIAKTLINYSIKNIIIDPVLVDDQGKPLFSNSLVETYRSHLLPSALCITPNIYEAELLVRMEIKTRAHMIIAARKIYAMGSKYVFIKRLPEGNNIVDILFDGKRLFFFESAYIKTKNTHGSGDTLSAAITACIAKRMNIIEAVKSAYVFTQKAIKNATTWNFTRGSGPVNHF